MHVGAFPILAVTLVSAFTFAAANPIIHTSLTERHLTERQSCNCQSPSGCPGRCAVLQGSGHSFCIGYCGRDNAVVCDACGFTTSGCIVNDDGSCFTVNE
ncbi:hypothetical protein B0H19DRAFT_1265305 [Mycena capillaripes]|nr:hypothetical protein B0H19DRAFT_1265305 [Mycena capillaripes]